MTHAERRLLKQLLHKLDSAREDITSILEDMRLLSQPFQEQIAIIDSVPGFDEESAMEIIAEISEVPQEHFATSEKLCSWSGTVPRNDESAGKIKSRKQLCQSDFVPMCMGSCECTKFSVSCLVLGTQT